AEAWLADEAWRPFDLARGPLARAALLRLSEDEHVLALNVHHSAGDGWSWGILFRDLSAAYEAALRGDAPRLPPPALQYADFAAWQRGWLTGEVLDAQLGWWRERLAGAPPLLELPIDRPRPLVPGEAGRTHALALSEDTTRALRALSRSQGATLFMTLLAGWQLLLSRYSGQDDVSVGTPVAGRTRLETEGLIGFFVNTLVLRTDLSGAPGFRALLGRVREGALGAFQHQDIPFEKLVEELAPERSLSRTPLFQALFALQNNPGEALRLGTLAAEPLATADEPAKFDLALEIREDGDRLAGSLQYRAELFDAGTIERMAEHFRALLDAVAAEPERPVDQVPFLAPAERRRIVEEWNATWTGLPDACVHQLFAERAARAPGAVAVVSGDVVLTYGELNERANRLAHHLRRRGVGPEVRVGICLERSLEMVVGILAVLKAGGAYVPLDPGYPAERLAFILADSATPVLLTREALRGALPAREGVEVVSLDGAAEEIAAESRE
ncbi:MAG TPA: condensation domain-containing protein, partial [Longimicrobium sp.]